MAAAAALKAAKEKAAKARARAEAADAAAAAAVAAAMEEAESQPLRPSRNAAKVANQKIKRRENPEMAAQAEISTFGMSAEEAAGARSPRTSNNGPLSPLGGAGFKGASQSSSAKQQQQQQHKK